MVRLPLQENALNMKVPPNCWNTTTKIQRAKMQTTGTQPLKYRVPTFKLYTITKIQSANFITDHLWTSDLTQFGNLPAAQG